ncbi:MAG: vWA domain-containing protein [Candidatus Loosdrechtia sp.]|uniref:vWA domain-containing protein n=1 Tax=Candidatus Loosdrechtia sp. TaxID=3101272 RepID=UPI003A7183C9|nr:MAG: VWA domain-containing protein [Candidatus Jettenia sp. AMX2]
MENNKDSLTDKKTTDGMIGKFRQKNWVKKLEVASGMPVVARVSRKKIVYLLMDCSGSMAENDKLLQAKKGAIGFADEAQKKEYAVGFIAFASHAEHILEPQNELAGLHAGIEKLSANGSTNMTEAIQIARNNLLQKAGEKVICIVTDGMPDDKKATLEAANELRTQGIEIMTIGTDDADKEFLEELATSKKLSRKVLRDQLEQGIISMAKMLSREN